MVFVDPTHSVERVCQGLDYGLEELESEMLKDNVQLKNLYVYSDCAAGDQKNKYFLYHLTELEIQYGEWLRCRYFNRPGNHNKFSFDSAAGLWKPKYFKAALNNKNSALQWAKGGLTNSGTDQLMEIKKFLNNSSCLWQKMGKDVTTTVRKTIFLPQLSKTERFVPYDAKGISKNFAFATIGFHKIAQRHLLNLSDACLEKAFTSTPELTSDEIFCRSWDIVDLSTAAYPLLTTPNKDHRIRGKFARDGKLKAPLRFTLLFTKQSWAAVSMVARNRKRQHDVISSSSSEEKSD